MQDFKSDWTRWSAAERLGAVALVVSFVLSGSSIIHILLR
jgi:hypothetical protein